MPFDNQGDAKYGALGAPLADLPAELQEVVAAWNDLPEAGRSLLLSASARAIQKRAAVKKIRTGGLS